MKFPSLRWCALALFAGWLASDVSRAAEDPFRFLTASEWQCSFSRSANDSGTGQYIDGSGFTCDQEWTVFHSSSLEMKLSPDGSGPFTTARIYSGRTDATPVSTLFETRHEDCVSPDGKIRQSHSYSVQASAQFPTPGQVSILIDAAAGTYSLDFNLPIGYEFDAEGTTVSYLQAAWFWNDAGADSGLHVTRPLPPTGTTLSGSASTSLLVAGQHTCLSLITAPAWDQMSGNLEITWNLTPKTNALALEVEIADYDSWLPEGNLDHPADPGKGLKFVARLVNGDGTPATDSATSFKCELLGVSHEPGVCINYPANGSSAADFKLLQSSNFPPYTSTFWLVSGETSMTTFFPGLSSADGNISCYDFGAFGTIKVTATVNGQEIVGYRKGDPTKEKAPIRVPKRASNSNIADLWKDKVQASSLADDDDSDSTPVGDEHKGDGFSLYEEYRGFAENKLHVRTNPDEKDFFVRNKVGGAQSEVEILKFEAASGLKVHRKLRSGEIAADGLMTVNVGTAHLHPQNGIYLRTRDKSEGSSEAAARRGYDNVISTPGSRRAVFIDPANAKVSKENAGADSGVFFSSIAHELSHCASAWHHGECDTKLVAWVKTAPDSGFAPYVEVAGSPPSVTPITIFNESGGPAVLSFRRRPSGVLEQTYWLGVPQGQHSGNINCLMCYGAATAFRKDSSGNRYVANWPRPDRTLLCESIGGNGPCGDAHEKRGNCKGQICVNDLYLNDTKHAAHAFNCP